MSDIFPKNSVESDFFDDKEMQNVLSMENIKEISFRPLKSSNKLNTPWRMEIVLKNGSYFVYPKLIGEVGLLLCNKVEKQISFNSVTVTRNPHVEFQANCDALGNDNDEYCIYYGSPSNPKSTESRKTKGSTAEFI